MDELFRSFTFDCFPFTFVAMGLKTNTCIVCIYLGFNAAFNTVQVISQQLVLRADKTSTCSWSRFCTVNCWPSVRNYHLSPIGLGV